MDRDFSGSDGADREALRRSAAFLQASPRDITQRARVEERLRKSEALLAEAQEIAGLGSWEWDMATNDVLWSAGLYRILGLDLRAGGGELLHDDPSRR